MMEQETRRWNTELQRWEYPPFWRIEYDNDTGPSDEGFEQWWTVTNDERSFRCQTEADANWLLSILENVDVR
jgi:hypothetical protein